LLDRVPPAARGGDYYLARAEILDASGNAPEGAAALEQALRTSPRRSGLYLRACGFLLRKGRMEDALRVSDQAMQAFAKNREILLLRAVVLEQAARAVRRSRCSSRFRMPGRSGRPGGWRTELFRHGTDVAAKHRAALGTAQALGTQDPQVRHYLEEISAGREAQPPDLTSLLLSKASGDQ
jgi:tetratricopeptide (TPR) repeat protein